MLQLGNFIFDIDDYPTSIELGGTSLVSVSKFPGGHKSVQNLGAFQDPITLTGTFMYAGAVAKMNQINAMWTADQPIKLITPAASPRWVLITSFKPVYYNDYQIDYSIVLEPLDSQNIDAVIYTPAPTTSQTSTTSTPSARLIPSAPQRTYIVQSGDTLWKIANKMYNGNGSLFTKIVSANNIKNPSMLKIGEKLIIP